MESIHSARAYYLQIVIPQYEAALAVLNDSTIGLRRDTVAIGNAALPCLHLADHVCRDPSIHGIPESPRTKEYVKRLVATDAVFEIVHDIANCFKHRNVSRDGAVVRSLDDIVESFLVVKYTDALGDYYGTLKQVLIQSSSGPLSAIYYVRLAVVGWGNRLRELGVIPAVPFIQATPAVYRNRKSLPETPTIEMLHEAGEFVAHQPLPCVYDERYGALRDKRDEEAFCTEVILNWKTFSSRFDDGARRIVESGVARLHVQSAK